MCIHFPLDHACTLLLKLAIRSASNGMFASLLTQSCRQVSPAVALLSANMYVNNQPVNHCLFRLNGKEATWSDGFLLGDLWVAAASLGQSNLCEMSSASFVSAASVISARRGWEGEMQQVFIAIDFSKAQWSFINHKVILFHSSYLESSEVHHTTLTG